MGRSLSSLRNGHKAHGAGAQGMRGHCRGGSWGGRWHPEGPGLAGSPGEQRAAAGTVRGADLESVLRPEPDVGYGEREALDSCGFRVAGQWVPLPPHTHPLSLFP